MGDTDFSGYHLVYDLLPEVFHRIIHEIFDHIPGVDTSMDNVLVGGDAQQEHEKVIQVVEKAKENNPTFNSPKCEISKKELVFQGDLFTAEGI